MEIMIEISEEEYNRMKDLKMFGNVTVWKNAICNGTPLPKGCGNLVDFDRLCKEYWDGNYMEIHKDDLPNIKPIIEAAGGGVDEADN